MEGIFYSQKGCIVKSCNCEDRPCCDCGQEYLAEMRYEASGGYADFRDPYDDDRAYFDMLDDWYDSEQDDEWESE